MGLVNYHRDLLPEQFKTELVCGGGQYNIDEDDGNTTVHFFGKSYDFGSFSRETLEKATLPKSIIKLNPKITISEFD